MIRVVRRLLFSTVASNVLSWPCCARGAIRGSWDQTYVGLDVRILIACVGFSVGGYVRMPEPDVDPGALLASASSSATDALTHFRTHALFSG
jgi:hypothetical protein